MEGEHYFSWKRKSSRIVSCIIMILLVCNMNLFAQPKLNFSFKNVPLKTAMTEIEKQSGYKFVFSASLIDVNKHVSGEFKNTTLDNVLHGLLDGMGVSYTVEGNQIILAVSKGVQPSRSGKIKITGTVTDETGQPFPFLNVFDTSAPERGAITDDNGKYTIEVPADTRSLTFSFMGYKTGVANLGKGTVVNYQMEPDAQNLDEIVIVGFGQQSKASVSAAVSSIKADEIIKTPSANVTNAIAGRVAGITTMQSSGQPGDDNATIIVRGQGSWNSIEPLYVIDGVERNKEMFAAMDANEIENFTILKDAAATAMYGSKGANGVVVVTSKRGQEGKVQVGVTASMSLQQFTRYPNYLDSYQSLQLYNEALMNDGNNPLFSKEVLEHYRVQDDPYRYPNTDWYNLMMKKVAPQYNVSVNLRGGSKSVRYFVSGAYIYQDGQLKSESNRVYNPRFSNKRYRVSANIDALITKDFTLTVDFGGSLNDRRDPYSQMNIFKNMNRMAPWYMPPRNPDGSYAGTAEFKDTNPMWMTSTQGSDQRETYMVTSSIKLAYDFNKWVKGLSVDARVAFDAAFYNGKYWKETQSTYQLISRSGRADRYISYLKPSFYTASWDNGDDNNRRPTRTLSGQANVVYNRKFGEHSVRIQGIASFQEMRVREYIPYNSASFIGRVNYSYKNKYNLEANASYRGSENFAPGRRFGLFPSVSASWNVMQEKFMKRVKFINNLKLRASFGLTGNDYVGTRFLYKEGKWSTSTSDGPTFGHQSGANAGSSGEPSIANPLATWEKAQQFNVGGDITIWKERLTLTFDRFWETRRDVLQTPRSIPSILGIGLPSMNIGETSRDGWEIELAYEQNFGKGYGFYVKGNVSFVKNKVVFKDEPEGEDWWSKEEGKPIGQNWGYVVEGFFRNQEEIDNAPKQQVGTQPIPGDLRYMDYNGDGVINTYDRVPIGYTRYPRYSFGLSVGFKIKNFDVSLLFQGTAQSSIFISDFLMYEFYNRGKVQDIHLGRWTPQTHETATYPALHIGATSQNHVSNTFFLKNNPYLRLKNVEIAYRLSPAAAKKVGMKGLRIYVSGLNLITWDKLKVVDPETPTNSGSGVYPQARNFSLGLNLNF